MPRKPIPMNLQLLEGNKNRKTKKEIEARTEAEESIKPRAENIKAPDWLDQTGKEEFDRLVELLTETKVVTEADISTLATYCDAYSNYVECTEIIQEEGLMVEYTNKAAETNKVAHPLLTKKKQLFEQMKTVASEFGLTPASRAKIAMPKKDKKEESPEEKMFGDV